MGLIKMSILFTNLKNLRKHFHIQLLTETLAYSRNEYSTQHWGSEEFDICTASQRVEVQISLKSIMLWASLVAQLVKDLLEMWETWV